MVSLQREIKRYELQLDTKLGAAEVDALTHQLFSKGVRSPKPYENPLQLERCPLQNPDTLDFCLTGRTTSPESPMSCHFK